MTEGRTVGPLLDGQGAESHRNARSMDGRFGHDVRCFT